MGTGTKKGGADEESEGPGGEWRHTRRVKIHEEASSTPHKKGRKQGGGRDTARSAGATSRIGCYKKGIGRLGGLSRRIR